MSSTKVLATFVGGWGHAEPLLPVARLADSLAHDVVFAGQAAVIPRLAALGFGTREVGPVTLSDRRRPLVAPDVDSERAVFRDHFIARYGAARAASLSALIASERPGVVLCDEADAGAVVAAEVAGVPCVVVSVLVAGRMADPELIGAAWSTLRGEFGLAPDDGCERFGGTLLLAPFPRSLRDPELAVPPQLRFVRPAGIERAAPTPARRPFVYATLGTVFNLESGDLLSRLVGAMALLDADSLVTTGPHVDRAALGTVAAHVAVEEFVPQEEALGRAAAVVCHGGSGTIVAALALGVPVVVIPMGADQLDNADRVAELGVGVVLDVLTADEATIAAAVELVIGDPRYGDAAAVLGQEAAGQPVLGELPELRALLTR